MTEQAHEEGQDGPPSEGVIMVADPHKEAIEKGRIEYMPYTQALKMALGKKDIYFSASNPNIDSPAGVNNVSKGGAVYLRPDNNRHLVYAGVLSTDVQGEKLAKPHKEDRVCDLPLVYKLTESKKKIADITDEDAERAGYKKVVLQARLALQTEHGAEFTSQLAGGMMEIFNQNARFPEKFPQAQRQAFANHVIGLAMQGIRYGYIRATSEEQEIAKQAVGLMQGLYAALDAGAIAIPGTTDVFSIGVARASDLVNAGDAATEQDASKMIGKSLRVIHDAISPVARMTSGDIRDEMGELYGYKEFRQLMAELDKNAGHLLEGPQQEKPIGWHQIDMKIRYLNNFAGYGHIAGEFRDQFTEARRESDVPPAELVQQLLDKVTEAEKTATPDRRPLAM